MIRYPPTHPHLNPTEGAWGLVKRGMAMIAARRVGHLVDLGTATRACQQQTDLLAGVFANTGMTLELDLL